MTRTLKLGTRRSLLAMAQSRAVAARIEALQADIRIELVGIETRGDRTLDVPLHAVDGKEFFVAELDDALLRGDVDLTVHSMKDLSLERPAGIALAAIPPRANPRDVLLLAPDAALRLADGAPLRCGTSSPRRIENLAPFLTCALPRTGPEPVIQPVEIRGNVHTRIDRLRDDEDSPNKVDAVVLALAGLDRLWADAAGRSALAGRLAGLDRMLLPLREYPTAPAQGALAVECRAADRATRRLLEPLNDATTAARVAVERRELARGGGGCHQRFGATAVGIDELGTLLFLRGRTQDDQVIDELRWLAPGGMVEPPLWDGTHWRAEAFTARPRALEPPDWLAAPGTLFIAHSRALPDAWCEPLRANPAMRIWTSGTASWFRLAARGIRVAGCAEERGFDALLPALHEGVMALPPPEEWRVLTHGGGMPGWPAGCATATYDVEAREPLTRTHPAVTALRTARSAFWTSASQFEQFRAYVPEGCRHACRYGRTFRYLTTLGIGAVTPFPTVDEWRKRGAQSK